MAWNPKALAAIAKISADPESDPDQGSAPESPVIPDDSEASDEVSSSQSAPSDSGSDLESGSPEVPSSPEPKDSSPIEDYHKFLINPEDIQKVADAKKQAGFLAGIGNSLGNIQSAGNFYLGHMNPKMDLSGPLNQMASAASVPIQTKEVMMKQYQEDPQLQLSSQMRDPSSGATKLIKSTALAAIGSLKPRNPNEAQAFQNLASQIQDPKSSGYDLQNIFDNNPVLKETISANVQGQRLAQMLSMGQAKLDQGQQRIDQGNQRIAKGASDSITNDKNVGIYQGKIAQIDTDLHTLETTGKMPPQLVNELSAGLASAFNGGKGAGFNQQQAQEIQSVQKDGAKVLGYLNGSTYDALPADQRTFLKQTLSRVKESYQKAQSSFANQKYNANKSIYQNNPLASQALDDARNQFSSQGGGPPAAQDPEIANYAKVYGYTYPQAEAIINARKQKLGGGNGQ